MSTALSEGLSEGRAERSSRGLSRSDEDLCQEHLLRIREVAAAIGRPVTIMEICGGHTNVIMKHGIRDIIPESVRLISGPGCPVCVTDQYDIDCMIALAAAGIPIATYGDMMRVPGSRLSLDQARAAGDTIIEVYSAEEAVRLSREHPGLVFFGIGFETTTPMTAYLLEQGVPVYSVHKLTPPAMRVLLSGEVKIDGFIDPGHVSTITGMQHYAGIAAPQVITGFTPERILRGLRVLLELIKDGKNKVVNAYPEVVKPSGNPAAQALVGRHLKIVDSAWRGLGVIPASGMDVRDDRLNARLLHKDLLAAVPPPVWRGCRCGDVLKGLIEPTQCPLYRKVCTPERPMGGCMVSEEGSCAIYFRYGK